MDIIIVNSADIPIYEQITRQIKDAILKGELREGELLPSVRALARDLNISVITTRRAYEELEKEGFTVNMAGKGTFVATQNVELLRESRYRTIEEKLEQIVEYAESIGVSQDEVEKMLDILFEEDR